ncbi:transporter particle component [Colletotrichum graminicola]|uniref:Transporter particle component n=1 Tax=Colletotrichum graminicola (strain M1.001 / M2 / FGSC 10212) TaxID=645133 RepID=E3QCQ4_COLGM|nr:transporter particle component [Colletotrichum graminicola M1.001]EFQ28642.1 transporter particle component [Colletotrichum graminicola M1.001]WDK15838.1 transporter particle component [Colletotrichum graminicola]
MSFESVMPPYNATDPSASFLNSSCLDFLLIELVPLAFRVTRELDDDLPSGDAANRTGADAPSSAGGRASADALSSVSHTHGGGAAGGPAPSSAEGAAGGSMARKMDEDEERDAVFYRLETLGYRVGQGLVERFSRDRPRFNDTLDVIKFVCKDLWSLVFRKQVDNLKTNHRGVYVLTDNSFKPFSRMSTEAGGQAVVRAQPFLWFPCGIVRGALAALGINATVQAETNELPAAIFQIKTLPSSA